MQTAFIGIVTAATISGSIALAWFAFATFRNGHADGGEFTSGIYTVIGCASEIVSAVLALIGIGGIVSIFWMGR